MYYENEYENKLMKFMQTSQRDMILGLMFRKLQEKIKDILENIANLDEEYLLGIFRACKEIQECRDHIAFSY